MFSSVTGVPSDSDQIQPGEAPVAPEDGNGSTDVPSNEENTPPQVPIQDELTQE